MHTDLNTITAQDLRDMPKLVETSAENLISAIGQDSALKLINNLPGCEINLHLVDHQELISDLIGIEAIEKLKRCEKIRCKSTIVPLYIPKCRCIRAEKLRRYVLNRFSELTSENVGKSNASAKLIIFQEIFRMGITKSIRHIAMIISDHKAGRTTSRAKPVEAWNQGV